MGPLATQKAPRDKAAQKSRDVVKEREIISGWLRNGEPGGVAGLAKVMAVDEAYALRRVDGYATTNRFHMFRDPNRPSGGVGVEIPSTDAGGGGGGGKGAGGCGTKTMPRPEDLSGLSEGDFCE